MTAKNNAKVRKHPYMAGSIFLGILALVFAANVLIRFPFQKAVSITGEGAACLASPGKQWFEVEAGSYVVEDEFETIAIRSSFLPLVSKHYTYFNVTVISGADHFTLPVRVTAKKAEALRQGDAVKLYGMVSQSNAVHGDQTMGVNVCLNDNGSTVMTRILSAGVFAVLTIGCIWLAVKIFVVQPRG